MTMVAQIASRSFLALWDTGATFSVLSSKLATELGLLVIPSNNNDTVTIADGTRSPVLGLVLFDITVSGVRFTDVPALVAPVQAFPLFLGQDFHQRVAPFLTSYNPGSGGYLTLYPSKSVLHFGSRNPQFKTISPTTLLLPARSSMTITLEAPSCVAAGTTAMFLPDAILVANLGILLTGGLVSMISPGDGSDRLIGYVRAVNTKSYDITLHAKQSLGNIQLLPSSPLAPAAEVCSITTNHDHTHHHNADRRTFTPARWAKVLALIDLSHADAEPQDKADLLKLLKSQQDVFSLDMHDLGRTSITKMHIDIGSNHPRALRPYNCPHVQQAVVSTKVQQLIDADLAIRSTSQHASPAFLVPKGPGPHDPANSKHYRLVVDYRGLNERSKGDAMPLPLIRDIFDRLGKATVFSSLDLASGYHQVELTEEAKELTAFCTPHGLFQFQVMPFGIKGAPACFVRLMGIVLADLPWVSCYLDDILIFSENTSQHLAHIAIVLGRLRDAGLTLSAEKCHFMRHSVPYLGHIVTKDGLSTNPRMVEAIVNWPLPTAAKRVLAFLQTANYYRRFIQGFPIALVVCTRSLT